MRRAKSHAALVILLAAFGGGCIAHTPTRRTAPVEAKPLPVAVTVVRFLPGDAFANLSAARVSQALVTALRRSKAFSKVAYALSDKDAHGGYLVRGKVYCGKPSSAINTNMYWKILLKISCFWVDKAPAVNHYNYATSVRCEAAVSRTSDGRILWRGKLASRAKGVFGERTEGDVEDQVMSVAEHNLAVDLATDVRKALAPRPRTASATDGHK